VAKRLGAIVSIISKVGEDFPEAYIKQLASEGVNLSGIVKVKNSQSTRFELKYSHDFSSRTLKLEGKAPAITVEDLPKALKTKAVHIGPIAAEVSYEVIEQLQKCCDLLSLDPQGITRRFDKNGNTVQDSLADKHILELIDVYKSSLDEIKAITSTSVLKSAIKKVHDYGVKTVIVTLGTAGAILSHENSISKIPAYKSANVIDPTGAGDSFIGAFLAKYAKGKEPLWCACAGSAVASLVVEAIGTSFSLDREEVYRRARVLYEKRIKQ